MNILASRAARTKGPAPNKQQGAVLIVCLIILTVLTLIAVGTITDSNLQSNMARNRQVSLQAFNVSLSELRAQYFASRNEQAIPSQLDGGVPASYLQVLSNARETDNPIQLDNTQDLFVTNGHAFTQEVEVEFIGQSLCGGGEGVDTMVLFELRSIARLPNSGINSDQSFGACYPGRE